MNVNLETIAELRKGLTGRDLAEHLLRGVESSVKRSSYATAHPEDQASYRAGLLTAELRRVCELLGQAVEDPEPNPTLDDLAAFESENAQEWRRIDSREQARADHACGMAVRV